MLGDAAGAEELVALKMLGIETDGRPIENAAAVLVVLVVVGAGGGVLVEVGELAAGEAATGAGVEDVAAAATGDEEVDEEATGATSVLLGCGQPPWPFQLSGIPPPGL